MDTREHTELGNGLRLDNIEGNPYLRIDEAGVLHICLQRFGENNLPEPMELELTTGEIVAMAGDYFTDANWTYELDLPHCNSFNRPEGLGNYLIRKPVNQKEETALITAYNNLAAPDVTRKQIDRIYTINNSTYIPFSSPLNSYAQQVMLYLRVKNYGEMLVRNQTHFTPWSVRVYVLGHSIALRYARLSYELKQLAADPYYQSTNTDLNDVKIYFAAKEQTPSQEQLIELAHRYHAQAYGMELFTFHYYSDHFATGHMAMVGDLRLKLEERFGTWGSILVNNLHDEINRVGVYTIKPYDPTPDATEAAIPARGDGQFDTCLNHQNKKACLAGMTASMADINDVLYGAAIPAQKKFGGLEHLPDVDFKSRQHEPLIVLSGDKIYRRKNLDAINIISPLHYAALRADPIAYGYVEITSKWDAFMLVAKLRLFPYVYGGTVQPLTAEQLTKIQQDEQQLSPQRRPIPEPVCAPEKDKTVLDLGTPSVAWRTKEDRLATLDGLKKHGLMRIKNPKPHEEALEETATMAPTV